MMLNKLHEIFILLFARQCIRCLMVKHAAMSQIGHRRLLQIFFS